MSANDPFLAPPAPQLVQVAAPPVGSDYPATVISPTLYARLLTGYYTLTTSAVVATRFSNLQIVDPNNRIAFAASDIGGITASNTGKYGLSQNASQTATGAGAATRGIMLPPVWLPPGYKIQTATSNMDAGDQYSIMNLLVAFSNYPAIEL